MRNTATDPAKKTSTVGPLPGAHSRGDTVKAEPMEPGVAPSNHRPAYFGDKVSRGLWYLDFTRLCKLAMRRTGLEDFGDPSLAPALPLLLESLENEAALRPIGRLLMRFHLRDLLETRLRLTHVWKENAKALEAVSIKKPVFIVGMPRSGSTFLHELLAELSDFRAPRVWEVMFPVASPRSKDGDRVGRIRKAAACLWWFRRLAPRADAVYPMRALTPHECVAIQSYTFLSEEFISTCRIPSYEHFLHSADLTPAYAWQKRFLQHLQLGCPEKRWILKSPDHVRGLEELFEIFPDAVIIQTHRNPMEVLKSSADLTQVLRGLYGTPGDPEETRAREATVLAEGTEQFIHFRDAHPELAHRFIDVKYTELTTNPVATVQRVCEQLDNPLTEPAAVKLQHLAANRSQYRGRRASAEPAMIRLPTALVTDRFERYCTRFDLAFQEFELKK